MTISPAFSNTCSWFAIALDIGKVAGSTKYTFLSDSCGVKPFYEKVWGGKVSVLLMTCCLLKVGY